MILVNGEATEVLTATDRGIAYGDGVFRTVAVRAGRVCAWRWQFAKLAADARRLGIACPSQATLHEEVRRSAAGEGDCAVKIIVTRGSGPRGYAPPPQARPRRVVLSSGMPPEWARHGENGVTVRVCALRLSWQPALAGIKHLNRLENVLARAEWDDPTIAEGLLQDGAGNVIGGTMSNLFLVEGDDLVTPDLSRCGVEGVTRERIMAGADRRGRSCRVAALSLERVLAAREVMLVNSLIGVWQVRHLNGRGWDAGETVPSVRQWLDENDD
jgi:4-amino-4-deoxychorismate lyase